MRIEISGQELLNLAEKIVDYVASIKADLQATKRDLRTQIEIYDVFKEDKKDD